MDNHVWSKLFDFFRELRCGDLKRTDYICLEETKSAAELVRKAEGPYELTLGELTPQQRNIIMEYVELSDQLASEESNQAYIQGYVDCVQLLNGLGLLEGNHFIEQFIKEMKE